MDGLPWYAENHGELFGVVARIDIKVGYSETESRKAASSMPNKHNALGRHHIPKMKFRVKNWAEYDAGLRRRGSLTLWITAEEEKTRNGILSTLSQC